LGGGKIGSTKTKGKTFLFSGWHADHGIRREIAKRNYQEMEMIFRSKKINADFVPKVCGWGINWKFM
jgi:hypothetical protein